ncbi:MAG: hypothetical protein AB7Q97_04875 [Gammaproteobacteria bacterium]
MKKNAAPQLSSSWWKSNRPEDVASADDLDKALTAYEKALASFAKAQSTQSLAGLGEALAGVEAAAEKVVAECEKALKGRKTKVDAEDAQNTVDALKKLDKVIAAARKDAAGKVKEDDEGEEEDAEADGLLNQEERYGKYLRQVMRKLKNAPMAFGLALGKKPEQHRMLFHKSKQGEALATVVKKETKLTAVTFGVAGGHVERPNVLVLNLDGRQLPGLGKKSRDFLKYFKPLPFESVMLMSGGKEVEDLPDVEEEDADVPASRVSEADFAARLKALKPRIDAAIAAKGPVADEVKRIAGEAALLGRKKQYDEASVLFDEIDKLLGASGATPGKDPAVGVRQALSAWDAARSKVVATLKELAKEVAAAKHPESRNALLELNAVMKQLAGNPDTEQKIADMARYLEQDDVVADVCMMAQDVRAPLMQALNEIKARLAA